MKKEYIFYGVISRSVSLQREIRLREREYQVSENFAPSAHKVTQLVIADTPFWGKEDGICFWKLNHMKM